MLIVGQILIMAFAIIIVDGRESRGVTETITSGSRLRNEIVIEKDQQLPHSQLIVHLPVVHTLFDQFIAKVVDISPSIESPIRDVNRTFLALSNDSRTIQLHTLHPGHTYSVAIIGRRGDSSSMMKEDEVTMDPYAPQFPIEDIDITMRNITLKVVKNEKYLQDRFLVNYRQLEPDKHYPILEILDIPEQKTLEIYIGNLNPGRDYVVDVVAVKSELKSKPWSATLSTKPSTVSNLTVSETGTSCLTVEWTIPTNSGADSFLVQYSKIGALSNHNIILPKSDREVHLCDDIIPGNIYKISVAVKKKTSQSAEKAVTYTVRPSKPEEFKIFPDITKGKYRLIVDLNSISHYDGCYVTVVSETLEKIERSEMLDGNDEAKKCSILLPLFPGERFEFTVSTFSHNVNSTKLHQSIALTPAFNMSGFGLTLQESRNGVELRWPQNDVFMARLRDIWNKVVGSTSQLQMRVFPTNGSGKGRRLYGNPYNATTLFIGPLKKGSCYKIQIFTVTKSGIVSETRFDEYFRMSAAPVNVSIHSITQTSAVINTVFISAGDVDPESVLNVVVIDMHGHVVFDKSQKSRDKIFSEIKLNGLRPYHKYTVNTKITCSSGPHDCSEAVRTMKQLTFSTMQDKPGPVLSPSVTALNPYSVQIEWLPPALPNGILTHYVINIVPEESSLMSRSINVGTATNRSDHFLETIVDGLLGGERYNFTICAATQAGHGEVSTVLPELLRMPIMAPPHTSAVPMVVENSITSYSLTVKYSVNMFNAKHGKIIRRALLVAEVTEDGQISETWMNAGNVTYTWMQVQRFDIWPLYTATVDEPHTKSTPSLTQAVGVDQSCEDLPVDTVCNGPLKADTNYKFKLRLFTAPNLFSDTEFSAIVTTEAAIRGVTLKIASISLFVVVVVGLLGVFFISYWNRSKKARDAYANSKETQWAALKMIMAERAADCLAKLGLDGSGHNMSFSEQPAHLQPTFGYHRRCRSLRERTGVDHRLERLPSGPIHKTPLYTVITGVNTNKSRPVEISDFTDHVHMMSVDSSFRFSEEYEILRNVGCGQTYSAAELPSNKSKNRFTNILPYDHSRVRLIQITEDEGADYVNANYMPGFSSRREFIAAQGPLPTTRDAFWQMVWEQGCPAIIALTKCVEKGRDKCHQYWPDVEHSTVIYGDIEVTMLNESPSDDFTVRELRLRRLHDQTQTIIIQQFHYMTWPDFGVPEHPQGIIKHYYRLDHEPLVQVFLRERYELEAHWTVGAKDLEQAFGFALMFRSRLPHSAQNKPTVVHCSAGVGRSGTFIAIDRLLQTLQIGRPIDVFGIVYEMRLERCHMVQNEQQYIFIHHCILYAIETMISKGSLSRSKMDELHENPVFKDDETIVESDF